MNLNFGNVESAIAYENMTISGGDILTDNYRRTVRVLGEFSSMEEIENIVVKHEKFDVVYLKDIAKVSFDFQERESYAREFTKPVVMLDVVKRSGANLIEASETIGKILEDTKTNYFPENLEISITNDQSDMIRDQVSNLENSIIFGVILVVLVLLFFLGLRNSLFVGVAIPLSMFMAYMILGAMGITLNMMVLFALILALGMLVDNGIVVVENVYRLMDEGLSATEAAKKGVGEVAWPIISSTATTLAVFIPLAFWPGMMGEFMKFLPMTLMIVLGSSLFVALVINPVLTAAFMRVGNGKINKRKAFKTTGILLAIAAVFYLAGVFTLANLLTATGVLILLNLFVLDPASTKFQNGIMPRLENAYNAFLSHVLSGKKPILYFFGTIGLLFFSFIIMGIFTPQVEFFPVNQPKYLNIFIERPIGADIESTNEITKKVEQDVIQLLSKYNDTTEVNGKQTVKNFLIESLIAQVGEGTSDPSRGPTMGNTPHKARVQVSFVEFKYRKGINTSEVMNDVRTALKNNYPGAQITVSKDEAGPPVGKPITIEVTGDDYDSLIVYAERIKEIIDLKGIRGIEELKLDIEVGKPEMLIEIDRAKARRLGVSTGQIGMAIRTAIYGKEVSKYKEGEDDYPINIRLNDDYRHSIDALMNQKIIFRDPATGKIASVPISSVAKAKKSTTFSAVKRKALQRVVTVDSNVEEGYNPTETVDQIKTVLEDFELPKGYSYKFAGQQEEQAKEMAFLSKALLIAVMLVFLIIVAQFNSAATPVIITTSVLLSLIGVLLGLVIFQMDFVIIMTMIGIISLAGVVVNNAIVLIDYTNLLRERKREELGLAENEKLPINSTAECIIEGGKKRLRPVLLTAITTVLGLFPLATGMNIDFFGLMSDFNPEIYFGGDNVMFWGPIAWTVIFGLTFATFLTLVIVPVMYYLLNVLKFKLTR